MTSVRRATERDIGAIVSIHMRAFKGFFLTLMGSRFLKELYRNFAVDEDGLCLVAEDNGRVIAFAAGALNPDAFFRRMRRQRWGTFLAASLRGFLRRPFLVLRKLVGALRYTGDTPEAITGAALLSSIAADPEFEGRGAGQAVLSAFCQRSADAGLRHVYLTTDRDGNERVNALYRKYGFRLESSFRQQGNRYMNRYVTDLEKRGGGGG